MITTKPFGTMPDGRIAHLYTLSNDAGMHVSISDFGGIITHLLVPIPHYPAERKDVVLGYSRLEDYLHDIEHAKTYFGAIIGRYINRIAKGKFVLDNKPYQLALNHGCDSLHGGEIGFNQVLWTAEMNQTQKNNGLVLRHVSEAGDQGFPGTLEVRVSYTLDNDKHALTIDYQAKTDQKTVLNLSHHPYFNLAGEGSGNILEHEFMLNAHFYTPTDERQLPTGEIAPVAHTPFDFRMMRPLARGLFQGDKVCTDNKQLQIGEGYDHNFVLDKHTPNEFSLAAMAYSAVTGITLQMYTTQPGIQFYTGNHMTAQPIIGKQGHIYGLRSGFALETQHFPDAVNHSHFPSTELNPNEVYQQTTRYQFD